MCYLDTNRPSLLFSVTLEGCAFQESSIVFSSYTFPQPNLSANMSTERSWAEPYSSDFWKDTRFEQEDDYNFLQAQHQVFYY